MNIYEFTYGGITDWIFAPNIREAKKFYVGYSGGDLEGYEIKRIPKSEWKDLYIIDPDHHEPDPEDWDENYNENDWYEGQRIKMSFEDYANQNTQTDIIATTAY